VLQVPPRQNTPKAKTKSRDTKGPDREIVTLDSTETSEQELVIDPGKRQSHS